MAMAPLAAMQPQVPPTARRGDGRPFATPFVRALAAERGIALTDLRSSGGRRRLDVADLQRPIRPEPTPANVGVALTSALEVDVTLAVRQCEAHGAPLVVLLMAAVAAALPRPVALRVVRYSSAGPESRLVTNACDLSLEGLAQGLAQGLTHSGDNRAGGFVIVDVSALELLSTAVELGELQDAALSMGVVTPRVAVGGDGVIAFRSTVQLVLTYHPHLFSLLDAAKFLSAVRKALERPSQAQR